MTLASWRARRVSFGVEAGEAPLLGECRGMEVAEQVMTSFRLLPGVDGGVGVLVRSILAGRSTVRLL